MDQVFREHKAGWHHIIPTKASTKDQLPYLETDNYKHEVLYVPGFDWLLDTTTRKLPKTYGLEAHAHRFPATFHAKVYTGLKYALITKLLRRKSRPTRLSDQVLYYSKYTPSISPEYVMRKIKTVENKFDHEADYKTYMENVNQQFIQKSYLISMMFAIFFAFWVAIFYTEYDDERAEARDTWTRAQMNKIFGLIYSNQDWENDAVKLKKNAYNTRAMYLKDQDDGKNPSQPVDPNQSFWQGQQEIAQNSSLNPSNYIKSPYDKKR